MKMGLEVNKNRGNKFFYEAIILGAVRTRATLAVEHYLSNCATRQTVLEVLKGKKVAMELINFDGWSWRLAFRIMTSGPQGRLRILDEQRTYLLQHPKRGNNRPKPVEEMLKSRVQS